MFAYIYEFNGILIPSGGRIPVRSLNLAAFDTHNLNFIFIRECQSGILHGGIFMKDLIHCVLAGRFYEGAESSTDTDINYEQFVPYIFRV